ncbi:MAG: ATP-binding protein [Candidatus Coatesbacteria bacterium]|nr:ATP-binding protein [Candidatus Coatesbacteria bacterium]
MLELSIHVLDIVQNSVAAGATFIEILITEDLERDLLTIEIKDNGHAMDAEMLRKAADPFVTTKPNKKVGLGLSLLAQAAQDASGEFEIDSVPGKGTSVTASFVLSSVDRMPLGDMTSTLLSLVFGATELDFAFSHKRGNRMFAFDTREVRRLTGGALTSDAKTVRLIRRMLEGAADMLR